MVRDARKNALLIMRATVSPREEIRRRRRAADAAGRAQRLLRRWAWLLLRRAEEVAERRRRRGGLDRTQLLRLRRWRRGHHRRRPAIGRGRGDRHLALGLFAADFAARPGEIVGASGRRRQRLALDQRTP